jgi:hypothetical protein
VKRFTPSHSDLEAVASGRLKSFGHMYTESSEKAAGTCEERSHSE